MIKKCLLISLISLADVLIPLFGARILSIQPYGEGGFNLWRCQIEPGEDETFGRLGGFMRLVLSGEESEDSTRYFSVYLRPAVSTGPWMALFC